MRARSLISSVLSAVKVTLTTVALLICQSVTVLHAQDTSAQEQKKERLEREIELINRQLSSTNSKSRSALATYDLVSKKVSNRQALLRESRRKERECADKIYLKQREINK